jgi:hypothetical protein
MKAAGEGAEEGGGSPDVADVHRLTREMDVAA